MNSTIIIYELHSTTEDIRNQNQAISIEGGNIPQSEMTLNETTATFNQYDVIAERGIFFQYGLYTVHLGEDISYCILSHISPKSVDHTS